MLLHQFILVVVATVKRFEAALLSVPAIVRRAFARDHVVRAEVEFEQVETERAA